MHDHAETARPGPRLDLESRLAFDTVYWMRWARIKSAGNPHGPVAGTDGGRMAVPMSRDTRALFTAVDLAPFEGPES
jgi:hypothetical protein